ncbi:MAG: exo-beta-N-acetylmuramidase NamZ domain-containing protein [Planctomycetota bacterium]
MKSFLYLRAALPPLLALSLFATSCTSPEDPPALPPTESPPSSPSTSLRLGIDVLAAENFARIAGLRIALLTHEAGRDAAGARTLDRLAAAPNVRLVRVFAPEHGLASVLDGDVGDARDAATGLPIHSLYGATRRPPAELLRDIDALVVDLQDIGTRFYTYITTLGYAMEECARAGVRVIVLDRPNPLGGELVDGPLVDANKLRFIAYRPIPVVHGLTIGELATYFNVEYSLGCTLEVVAMQGWRRDLRWTETGIRWHNPSPNMRSATAALLYPAIGLLEACNLSVGRGTPSPFEIIGAPWIASERLADAMQAHALPGLGIAPTDFTPSASEFAGERCFGLRFTITDPALVEPIRTGLTLAWELRRIHADQFDAARVLDRHLNSALHERWFSCDNPAALAPLWHATVEVFRRQRKPALLY